MEYPNPFWSSQVFKILVALCQFKLQLYLNIFKRHSSVSLRPTCMTRLEKGTKKDKPRMDQTSAKSGTLQISKCSAIFTPAKGLKTALAQRLTIEIPAYVFEIPGKVALIVTDYFDDILTFVALHSCWHVFVDSPGRRHPKLSSRKLLPMPGNLIAPWWRMLRGHERACRWWQFLLRCRPSAWRNDGFALQRSCLWRKNTSKNQFMLPFNLIGTCGSKHIANINNQVTNHPAMMIHSPKTSPWHSGIGKSSTLSPCEPRKKTFNSFHLDLGVKIGLLIIL